MGRWGDGEMGRWGDGNPPLTPPRRGIWGDGEMGSQISFPSCLLPLASCLLPVPYSLFPVPYSRLPIPSHHCHQKLRQGYPIDPQLTPLLSR